MSVLRTEGIDKYYGDFCALRDVSLDFEEDEFVSVIGPNGAGKTTLINVITGLLEPTDGKVYFKGEDVTGREPEELIKKGIGRSFQLVNIFPELTVQDTLRSAILTREDLNGVLYANVDSYESVTVEATEIAEIFGLQEDLDEPATNLPQGGKKLLDVATIFASQSDVIFLDEPTSGVSTSEKTEIMETLSEAAAEADIKTIVQIEHDMDIVFNYSDRIIALQDGEVLADGTPEEIRENRQVRRQVLGLTDEEGAYEI